MINNKYKFYQNKNNSKLDTLINSGACIWNHCVSRNKRFYQRFGKSVPKKRMRQQIAKIRKRNPYWKQLNSQSVQEVVDRFYISFDKFFKKIQKRPPKIKKWKQFKSFMFTQSGFSIENNVLTINKIGKFKFSKSRDFSDIRQVRISRNRCGEFFLTVTSSSSLSKSYEKTLKGASVGIDFGLKTFLTLSDGIEIDSPLFYNKFSKEIKKKQRKFSKTKKGSNNRFKKAKDLAKIYRKIRHLRENHQWQLSHWLCKSYDFIVLENLNLEAMKKLWGRKISDLSFSSFLLKLQHVATKYGTVLEKIDRFFPSSKTCYSCGNIKHDLNLRDRIYICEICGYQESRDLNAAQNILREGILSYRRICETSEQLEAEFV